MARAIELKSSNAYFAASLLASRERDIVELSTRDAFWGAKPIGGGRLKGVNVQGQLLMQRRAALLTAMPPASRMPQSLAAALKGGS